MLGWRAILADRVLSRRSAALNNTLAADDRVLLFVRSCWHLRYLNLGL